MHTSRELLTSAMVKDTPPFADCDGAMAKDLIFCLHLIVCVDSRKYSQKVAQQHFTADAAAHPALYTFQQTAVSPLGGDQTAHFAPSAGKLICSIICEVLQDWYVGQLVKYELAQLGSSIHPLDRQTMLL